MTFVPHRHRKLQNIYGNNIHVVSYAVGITNSSNDNDSGTCISWAVTREEKEGRESWKTENGDSLRKELLDQLNFEWDSGVSAKELMESSPAIIKVRVFQSRKRTFIKKRSTNLVRTIRSKRIELMVRK